MRRVVLLLFLMMQVGCISTQMQYESGKNAIQLSERRFLVSYANSTFPPALVQVYLLRNCGETALKNGFSHFVLLGNGKSETIELINNERYPVITATSLLGEGAERVVEYEDGTREAITTAYKKSLSVEMIGLNTEDLNSQNRPYANDAAMVAAFTLKRPIEHEISRKAWRWMGGTSLSVLLISLLLMSTI